MQKSTKWLIGLIAALVVMNVILVATIWLKNEKAETVPTQRRGDARDYLVTTLSLNKAQIEAFDSLRQGHFERIEDYKMKMRLVKDRLFSMLQEKDTTQIKLTLSTYLRQKIGELQANIDVETFEHFRQLRNMLYGEQQEKFDRVIQNVLRTMAPKGPPPGGADGRPGPPPGEGGPPPHDGPPNL